MIEGLLSRDSPRRYINVNWIDMRPDQNVGEITSGRTVACEGAEAAR
jgi:hypothetical protein